MQSINNFILHKKKIKTKWYISAVEWRASEPKGSILKR